MKKFDFNDCIREGLLRNVPSSKEKSEGSVRTAQKWLKESKASLKGKAFNSSVIGAYLAMFHSARAILFFDGFREKSHYCLARYLEEKYVKPKILDEKWVEMLDYYRDLRHDDQYSVSFFATEEEAKAMIQKATEFVGVMSALLNKLQEKKLTP